MTTTFLAGRGGRVSADPVDPMAGIRGYLRHLRLYHKISQEQFAKEIGLSRRAYLDWEVGKTHELKQGPLIRAVIALRASWNDIQFLSDPDSKADEVVGQQRADAWLAKGQQGWFDEVVAGLTDAQLIEAMRVIDQLRARPELLSQLINFGQYLQSQPPADAPTLTIPRRRRRQE